MIQVEFTADDLVRTRHLPEPAPLVELKLSLMMLRRRDNAVFFGRWRRRVQRSLPSSARPLFDLVFARSGPAFLDPPAASVAEGLAAVREAPGSLVRLGVEQLPRGASGAATPGWPRGLVNGRAETWDLLCSALQAAYDSTLGPVWSEVEQLHRTEFTRYALSVAESGLAGCLARLLPGARFGGGLWEVPAPYDRHVRLGGRGLTLVPTFHWTDAPVFADVPGRPVLMAYPAGPGTPVPAAPEGRRAEDTLTGILGPTRAQVLRLLSDDRTTSEVARLLGVSVPTASAHTTALRGAGLVASTRAGRAVRHRRTALGTLLTRPAGPASPDGPSRRAAGIG